MRFELASGNLSIRLFGILDSIRLFLQSIMKTNKLSLHIHLKPVWKFALRENAYTRTLPTYLIGKSLFVVNVITIKISPAYVLA